MSRVSCLVSRVSCLVSRSYRCCATLLIGVLLLSACGQPLRLDAEASATSLPFVRPSATSVAARSTPQPTPASPTQAAIAPTDTPPPSATSAPSTTPAPSTTVAATRPPVVVIPQRTPDAVSNEARWRAQQQDREVFAQYQIYQAQQPVALLWYDPLTGQSLEIGTLLGPFTAQAQFVFRPSAAAALEVPYRINGDFGLTAISPSVVERMKSAGYNETVEAYVVLNDAVRPR